MKKLLLLLLVLSACCVDSRPDHKATVVLNHDKYPADTITINYSKALKIEKCYSPDRMVLTDANGNEFGECSSFSILEEELISSDTKVTENPDSIKEE